ncbi:MAG TPA: hypothetical protein VIP30_07395 [Stenotrophomonas sp.]
MSEPLPSGARALPEILVRQRIGDVGGSRQMLACKKGMWIQTIAWQR